MKTAFKISLVYLFFGFAWLLFFGSPLLTFFAIPVQYSPSQILKDAVFVLASALLIFLMIRSRVAGIQNGARVQQREEQFQSILGGAPDAVYVQTEYSFAYLNPAALKLFGAAAPQELLGRPVLERFHPSVREIVKKRIHDLNNHLLPAVMLEEVIVRLDGSLVPVEVSAVPFLYEGKNGALVFVRDITERKRSEEQIRESEERLNLVFEAVSDGVWDWNLNTNDVYFSPGWYSMLGYEYRELPENLETWKTLVHPDDLSFARQIIADNLQTGNPFELELRMLAKDGHWKWILTRGKVVERDGSGKALRVLGTHVDISDIKQLERESSLVLETAFDGFLMVETSGVLLRVNEAAARMLGYTKSELTGKRVDDIVASGLPEAIQELIKAIVEKGGMIFETCLWKKDGEQVEIEASVNFLDHDGGRFLVFFRDITARKQTVLALRESEDKLKSLFENSPLGIFQTNSKGEVLAINSRMAAILGATSKEEFFQNYSDLGQDLYEDPWKREEFLNLLTKEGRVLDFEYEARRLDGNTCWISMNAIMKEQQSDGSFLIDGFAMDVTERKHAELELENIFNLSLDMISISDVETSTFTRINPAFAQVLGYDEKDLLNQPYTNFIHPEDLDPTRKIIEEKLKSGVKILDFENRFRTKDGSYRYLRWVANPIPELGLNFAVASDITDRKAAETALKESESLFRSLFEDAPLPYQSLDDSGRFLDVNAKWLETMGYSKDEVVGSWFGDFLSRESREDFNRNFPRLKQACMINDVEFEMIKKSGGQILIILNGTVQQDQKGNFLRAHCIFNEITKQRRMELALQESEARYQAIFNAFPDLLFLLSNKGIFIGLHGREDLLHTQVDSFIGKTPEKVFPVPVAEQFRSVIEQVLTVGGVHDYEYSLEIDGKDLFFDARMFQIDAESLLVTVRDITDKKKSEKQIFQLTGAVTHAAGSIVIISSDRIVQYVNPAFERISGFSASEVIGRSSKFLNTGLSADEQEKIHYQIWEKILQGKLWKGRLEQRTKSGEPFVVDATISPITNEVGELVNVVSFWMDVTKEEQLQKQLIHSQKMEAIGTLAGGIAHDFNNILGSIIGFSELAQMKSEGNTELKQDLEMVLLSAERAKDLVKQILTFSRKGDYQKRPMNLVPLLQETVKMLRATIPTSIEITFHFEEFSNYVLIDPVQMHQVLTNLCSNATHAMPNGGKLLIQVKNRRIDAPPVPDLTPGDYIEVTVQDDGLGMPHDILEKIFDPFFTTKKPGEGTGMGLSVVHGIVCKHNGHISVQSEFGKGTTFPILLPKVDLEPTPEVSDQHYQDTKAKGRILFVDDEEFLVRLAEFMLPDLGYSVETSQDSVSALERIKQHPDSIDLVVTDLTMPHLSGLDLTREIKKIRKDLPVLLCSGNLYSHDEQTLRGTGVSGFVQKPFNKEQMATAIRKLLTSRN